MNIEKKIESLKNSLIKKAKLKGLYENFGDKEIRILEDLYPKGYMGDERKNMDLIDDFSKWCRNCDDNTIKVRC